MNFDNIEYLQHGNDRQRQAYSILTNNQVLSKLKQFDPVLVGTIPINIDIENSDLDIICCFSDKQEFQKSVTDNFGKVTSVSVGSSEDTFNMGTYPYIDSISLNAYLEGVIKQPYQYYFNDLYIVPGISYLEEEQFYRYIKHPFETANDVAPLKMIDLRKKNKYYIWTEGKNAGKFWRLRGEWEHFVVPYKFRFFQYVSPE